MPNNQTKTDALLFAVPKCYPPASACILEVRGERLERAFHDDPTPVEEWVQFTLAGDVERPGIYVWSGRYEDAEAAAPVGAVRQPTEAEWNGIRTGEFLPDDQTRPPEGMLFEVMRTSHLNAGWVGENASGGQPTDDCVFNADERRWELRLNTLGDLAAMANENSANLLLCFSASEPDLPVIEIRDEESSPTE
jgi:hypothetical protein